MNGTEAEKLLLSCPKKSLGFFPTPLHKLDKLSRELGVNLYLKRDDLTGISVFGGNKIRKLEFLIQDAMEQGCDTVFTFGATQSNHAMQTVTACRRYGLTPILYLVAIVEPSEKDIRANMLLDKVMGAELHIVPLTGMTGAEATALSMSLAEQQRNRLEAEGHRCYMVPVGGATAIGSAGFINGFAELCSQMATAVLHADFIFHSSGSGGTHAGLIAGRKILHYDTNIIGISAGPKPPEHEAQIAKLASDALAYIGSDLSVSEDEPCFDQNYYGPGYEIPSEEASEAIQHVARTEGILLDPVYTGKAFAGMLDYIRKGKVSRGSTVVFWHTGGVTALFAEKQVIGNIF